LNTWAAALIQQVVGSGDKEVQAVAAALSSPDPFPSIWSGHLAFHEGHQLGLEALPDHHLRTLAKANQVGEHDDHHHGDDDGQ
jgi:hypothetical protein